MRRAGRVWPRLTGWVAALLAPAADPRLADRAAPLQAAHDHLALTQRQVATHLAAMRTLSARLEARARRDLASGDDAAARQALRLAVVVERQRQALEEEARRLAALGERLAHQLAARRTQDDLTAARAEVAAATAQLDAILADLAGPSGPRSPLVGSRAWAEALAELADETTPLLPTDDGLADALTRLELDQAVAERLARLRPTTGAG